MKEFKTNGGFDLTTWNNTQRLLKTGKEGERILGNHLNGNGYNVKYNDTNTYDLIIEYTASTTTYHPTTIELKTDSKARTTKNIFIEFEQNGKESGIAVSKSKYHAFLVASADTSNHICYLIPTKKIKLLISEINYKKANGHESLGYVVPINDILNITHRTYQIPIEGNHINFNHK